MSEIVISANSVFKQALVKHQEQGNNLADKTKRQGSFEHIKSDLEAIELWLHNQYRNRVKTRRAYSKEVLRFLLWAGSVKLKSFSTLDEHDIEIYFQFILNPEPRELWCLDKPNLRPKKDSPDWRPFAGPIKSVASYNQAIAAISSCFSYLFDVGYLKFDPFRIIRLPKFNISCAQKKIDIASRTLSALEWNQFIEALLNLPETAHSEREHKARLRFIVTTLYFLGLRCEELVTLKWSDFVTLNDCWLVRVAGKGRSSSVESDTIVCSKHYLKEVEIYRSYLNEGPLSENNKDEPVFFSLKSGRALTSANIRRLIKEHAKNVAEYFDKDSVSYKRMCAISPHWLRHLCASKLNSKNVPIAHIKEHLRHKNAETTYLYIHNDLNELLEQINKVGLVDE